MAVFLVCSRLRSVCVWVCVAGCDYSVLATLTISVVTLVHFTLTGYWKPHIGY